MLAGSNLNNNMGPHQNLIRPSINPLFISLFRISSTRGKLEGKIFMATTQGWFKCCNILKDFFNLLSLSFKFAPARYG